MKSTYPVIKSLSPQLLVTNLARSLNFYTEQLGFKVDFLYEDFYAGITRNGYSVHLKTGTVTLEERTNRLENEHLDLVFSIENINEFFDAVENQSPGIIIQPLREMPYGREFYITDPDGHILGFMETE